MARGSSILSAILGGVSGGVEAGLAQRERERVARDRQSERERMARAERLQFMNAGFVPEEQAGARDMPGATPRTPFATETMAGGQRMVMMDAPDVQAHRAGMMQYQQKRGQERAEAAREQAATQERASKIDAALEQAGVSAEQRGLVRSGALKAEDVLRSKPGRLQLTPSGQIIDLEAGTARNVPGFRMPPRADGGLTAGQTLANEERRMEALAWFNTPKTEEESQALEAAFNSMRQSYPDMSPDKIITAIYGSWKSQSQRQPSGLEAFMGLPSPAQPSRSFRPDTTGGRTMPPPPAPSATPPAPSPAPQATPQAAPQAARTSPFSMGVNPLAGLPGDMSMEQARSMGLDVAKYRSDPAYRAFVDRQMGGR